MEYIVFGVGLFVIGMYLFLVANDQSKQILAGQSINHKIEAYKRGCVFAGVGGMILFATNGWFMLLSLLIYAGLWWFVFDPYLNKKMGVGWLYVGITSSIDKWFRKTFPKRFEMAMLSAKILFLTVDIAAMVVYLILSSKSVFDEIKVI